MFTDVPLTSQPVYGSLSVCVHLEQWIRSPVIFFFFFVRFVYECCSVRRIESFFFVCLFLVIHLLGKAVIWVD